MRCRQYTSSSHATTPESNKSVSGLSKSGGAGHSVLSVSAVPSPGMTLVQVQAALEQRLRLKAEAFSCCSWIFIL